jgi:hypothetical protein
MQKAFVLFGHKKEVKDATFTSDEVNYNHSWSTSGTVKATGEDVIWNGEEKVWRLRPVVEQPATNQNQAQDEIKTDLRDKDIYNLPPASDDDL